MKKGIIIIALGFILLAADLRIPMGEAYPPMRTAEELGAVLQDFIINNLIGSHPKVDILSDVLGFALLFVGSLLLIKYNKKLWFAIALIPYAVYVYFNMMWLPYNFELGDLYLKYAGNYFLLVTIEILIELTIIKSLVSLFRNIQTKWNVNEMLIGWILAMISKGILSGIQFFYGRGVLYYVYSVVLIGATVFYLNRLYVITKYRLEGADDEK